MPSDSLQPELLELIVRTSRDGIVITDEDGDLVFVNPAAAIFFGYAPKNWLVNRWRFSYRPNYEEITVHV